MNAMEEGEMKTVWLHYTRDPEAFAVIKPVQQGGSMLETNWDRICARLDKTAADIIAMRTALEHMASRIVQMEETQALQRLSLNNAFDRLERLEEARDGREEAEKSGAGSVAQ